jgi:hypothetical protein
MNTVCTAGYSCPQLLTRRHIFNILTGSVNLIRCNDAREAVQQKQAAVFLNCETDPGSAESEFSLLQENNCTIIVYTDRPLNGLLVHRFRSWSRCSLVICPEERELEDFRTAFQNGKTYHTVEAQKTPPPSVPLPGYGFEELSEHQQTAVFCILRGDNLKTTAGTLGTSLKSANNILRRVRELFGNSQSNEEFIENFSWAF